MDYAAALKKVQAHKQRENYMMISLSYDKKLILPFKEGLAFMAALNLAEQFDDPYGKAHRIVPLDRSAITTTILSGVEYEQYKIAALMGVSIELVKEAAEAAVKPAEAVS